MKTFSRTIDGLLAKISETAAKGILVAGAVVIMLFKHRFQKL